MSGLFIAFEGGEGAGKSTQANILRDTLRKKDYRAKLVREPGSTDLGEYLRDYLLRNLPVAPRAELLLFEAARAQLMAKVVEPALAQGKVVIADRFGGSTVAYQGYGRGIELNHIKWLTDFATGGRCPDLTILLDIDPAEGLIRSGNQTREPGQQLLLLDETADRFTSEATHFHYQVRQGFIQQAAGNPDRWRRIAGDHPLDDVAAAVWDAVSPLLPK